uniref:Uncharacterized protein n=1 Tax=Dunaliella tertiolecta TaxID=3047 RepID=A0A7S3VKQ0_DUNTE|mmetsp:Transcript_7647/g.20358  ORF Transcript_7647/g.20358 Transcript_7647/m.20358 type:complete len:152 (+) Transcript_7647:1987-2442(+)
MHKFCGVVGLAAGLLWHHLRELARTLAAESRGVLPATAVAEQHVAAAGTSITQQQQWQRHEGQMLCYACASVDCAQSPAVEVEVDGHAGGECATPVWTLLSASVQGSCAGRSRGDCGLWTMVPWCRRVCACTDTSAFGCRRAVKAGEIEEQ